MSQRKNIISDKKALNNLEVLLKIPLIKRFGIIGVSDIMSKRAVKFKPSEGNLFYKQRFGNVECDVISKPAQKNDTIILYFHLGAFVSGTTDTHRTIAEQYLLNSEADKVIVVNYRTAPEFTYPCAHDDSFEVYQSIVSDNKYINSKIITAGDSSGGNLALSIALMARDRGLRLPDGINLISPWVDFTQKGKSYSDNFNSDPMFGYLCTPKDKEFVQLYAKDAKADDPYLSPVFAEDYIGLPSIYIQVSDNEMLLDDAMEIKKIADKSDVDCVIELYHNMFHSFQTVTHNAETSRKAWQDTGKFINSIINKKEG